MVRIEVAKRFVVRYEYILSPLAVLGGFVLDSLTLRRVDLLPETILLYSYLATVGTSIFLLHLIEGDVLRGRFIQFIRPWLVLLLQFTYGSLFSAFLIFYSKSASIAQSWPFLVILLGVCVGAEIFKAYNARLTFQLSIFYFALLSFCIVAVPLYLGEINTRVFLISGAASIIVFILFFLLLFVVSPSRAMRSFFRIALSVAVIYGSVNALFFLDVLPPIPLALKDIGVYHLVSRDGQGYLVEGESYPWPSLFFSRQVVHLVEGEPVFAFSSVFAPVVITTDIVHRWEYWSDLDASWVTSGVVRFPVNGGRDGGYRGFSYKRGVFPGLWRVTVETPNEQRIGQTEFKLVFVDQAPLLISSLIR